MSTFNTQDYGRVEPGNRVNYNESKILVNNVEEGYGVQIRGESKGGSISHKLPLDREGGELKTTAPWGETSWEEIDRNLLEINKNPEKLAGDGSKPDSVAMPENLTVF